tara:strand:- start:19 stop:1524 length:1506 start_codon:yes stop_codon:yes gene_type:complete
MLALLSITLLASHVPVTRLRGSEGTQDTLVVAAKVHAAVDVAETVYLVFDAGVSAMAARFCPGREKRVPVYFDRHAFWVPCSATATVSVVRFKDLNTLVTLTDESIEFCHPSSTGNVEEVATAPCIDLDACIFTSAEGTSREKQFRVSASARQHRLPLAVLPSVFVVGHGKGLKVDATDYNHYITDEEGSERGMPVVALVHARAYLHFNGTHHSLWSVEAVDTATNLFTMALMLVGAIMFIPTSVEVTNNIVDDGEEGVRKSVSLLGDEDSMMHAIVVDFATSAACVTVYVTHANGLGKGTFNSEATEEMTWAGDALTVALSVSAAISVTCGVLRCRAATAPVHNRSWAMRKLFGERVPPTGIVDVVVTRIGFEFAVVVAFMASCPLRMGRGFVQCLHIVSSAVLLVAIGRDAGIVARNAHVGGQTKVAAVFLACFAACPLGTYGVKPIITRARSFASNDTVTWTVTAAVVISFLCAGAASVKGRLRNAVAKSGCGDAKDH